MSNQVSAESTATDSSTPSWLDLADGESVRWQGTRRIWVILPTAVVGGFLTLGVVTVMALLPIDSLFAIGVGVPLLALFALGLLWQSLSVRNTEYVATDRHLYRKQGVLSRSVTTVDYGTVQNVTYSQTITGRLFDHGTLAFDTAGGSGTELSFDDIDDPRPVESLVNEQMAHARGEADDETLPGTVDQWEAVLDEVRAIRQSVER